MYIFFNLGGDHHMPCEGSKNFIIKAYENNATGSIVWVASKRVYVKTQAN